MKERTNEEIKKSLHLLAKQLGIIPKDFSEDDFRARFFYFFIERDHKYAGKKFTGDLFDENEPNYYRAMLIAFEAMFSKLIDGTELSLELINELHQLSTEGVLKDHLIKYRDKGGSVGFLPRQTSLLFLEKIAAENYETKLDLTGESVAEYFPNFDQNKSYRYSIEIIENMSPIDVGSLEKMINDLIECYKNKLEKIKKNAETSEDEKFYQKINLIGSFIGDMDRLHPYRDGNGRLNDFLLANYLLTQEGMSPCIIFQPWHFGYLTAEERVFAIIEGQEAYKHYFVNGNPITNSRGLVLRELLTEKMKSIPIKFVANNHRTYKKIIDLFLTYTQILAAELLNENPNYHPKINTTKLKESLGATIIFLTQDPHNIKNLESFCLPLEHQNIIRNITLAGALPFFDRDTTRFSEEVRHSFLQDHYEFDIEKYNSNPKYKSETLKKCLPRKLDDPCQLSLFLDYASDLDYQNNEEVRTEILLSLKEYIDNQYVANAQCQITPQNHTAILKYIESELLRPAILEDVNSSQQVIYSLGDLLFCLDLRGYKDKHQGYKLSDGLEEAIIERHPDLKDKIRAHFQSVRDFGLQLGHPKSEDSFSFDSGLSFAAVAQFIKNHCLKMLEPKTSPEPNLGTAASLQGTQQSGMCSTSG